ncbi:MAG: hypothetical protein ACYTDT_07760 [Planctomycetota bacterium]|jgi:hypothetical protein
MTEPEVPVANFAKSMGVETGLKLSLDVTDPDVVRELSSRDGPERDQYALTALRVGVLALRAAGGVVDAEKLKSEGERLIHEVEKRLTDHSNQLDKELEGELKRYFDPESGHFKSHVEDLVSDEGKLVQVLKAHVEGDNSALAKQLAAAVGDGSPLMNHLSPEHKDGLIQTITRVAEERLEEQSKKVLGEFDLNNEDGALKRLIKSVDSNFDVNNKDSALSVMNAALDETRQQIRKDLSLDEEDSALSNLHGQLKKQINELVERQVKFQKEVADVLGELRGAKNERDKSPSGGFDFEDFVSDAIRERIPNTDVLADTGEEAGLLKGKGSKVGDHVQTLGEDTVSPGSRIVFESKRAENYTLARAIEELETAKQNRDASVGVFVLSASSVRNSKKMQVEFATPLQRNGMNIVVVWDHEDDSSNVNLDAAITLARAIVVQTSRHGKAGEADWDTISKAVHSIERQIDYFSEMTTWSENVMRDGKKIKERMAKMQDAMTKELDKLTTELDALK